MAKGKVIIIGTAYPLRGGLASYNERLARAFMSEGYEVIIHTFVLQYPRLFFPGKTQYADSRPPEDLDIRITIHSVWPLNWFRTGRMIRNEDPDLVIIKYWHPFMAPCFGALARIIRKNAKTRIVSILDNVIPHESHPADRSLTRYFIRSVDAFVGMSHSVLYDLRTLDTSRPAAYCPHPLYDNYGEAITREQAIRNLSLDPSLRYLLFFGFIREYKGLDLLLYAFAALRQHYPFLRLLVAGEFYTSPAPYLSIIEKYGMQKDVLLHTHYIPDDTVASYFCASDLVIQPYRSATQSGITQIAYHFDKPMLVTNAGGLAEIVPHGKAGYVVDPSVEPIITAVSDFIGHERGEELTAGVREQKKLFSWQRMVKTIETLSAESKSTPS